MRVLVVLVALWAVEAAAFPWMVKHTYGSCASCHVDPSGGGQLTTFGRTEAERLLRWTPAPRNPVEAMTSPLSRFLWFLALPEAVNLSGDIRFGALVRPGAAMPVIPLEKAFDLSATFTIAEKVLIHATAGFGRGDAVANAIVVPACDPAAEGQCGASLMARTFWVGLRLAEGRHVVRAGRLAVPFGLRNIEHTSWVRQLTRTDVNVQQQLGLAVSYSNGPLRGELMGLAGGFLPSTREAGYATVLEYGFAPTLYAGFSSLVAQGYDSSRLTRYAHGLTLRWAPVTPLVIVAEADLLGWAQEGVSRVGYAAFLQGDWEPVQGLHVMATLESAHQGPAQRGPSLGAWLSAAWYFFSHLELRLDNVLRRVDERSSVEYSLVVQLHAYL